MHKTQQSRRQSGMAGGGFNSQVEYAVKNRYSPTWALMSALMELEHPHQIGVVSYGGGISTPGEDAC
eukprot:14145165-Ditylum_brightwellii.AAC.1